MDLKTLNRLAQVALTAVWLGLNTAAARPPLAPQTIPATLSVAADGDDPAAPSTAPHDQGALSLEDVKSGRSPRDDPSINPIRAEALKEAALAYAARAGLYARGREINRALDESAGLLDKNFPFAPLVLSHNVVPPVLQTGRDTVRKNGDAQLRFADAVYEIVAPAKLVVAPPDWRNYLYVRVGRPEPPDETLLPDRKNAAEVAYWERYVERGWRRGVLQADQTFAVQLNRLERDLGGMILYRELLAKGMVTPPRLTEQLRGITADRNLLRVNDRVLDIAENTRFVADNQRWKPYATMPYRPPKHAPKVDLRVLAPPPPPPADAVAPAPSPAPWSRPWER